MVPSRTTPSSRLHSEVPEVPIRQSDAELVARAQAKEAWAEEAIFRRYAPMLSRLALKLVGERSEAEDVVQETFVLALESIHRLRDGAALAGWLKQIAISRAHRRFRRRRLLDWLGFRDDLDLVELGVEGPRGALEPAAELCWLYRCLDALPADQRIPWCLRHLEDLDLSEIAILCGCSLATIKRKIARAQAHVDRHLAGPEVAP